MKPHLYCTERARCIFSQSCQTICWQTRAFRRRKQAASNLYKSLRKRAELGAFLAFENGNLTIELYFPRETFAHSASSIRVQPIIKTALGLSESSIKNPAVAAAGR